MRRQCRLMSLNRSTLYYEPKGESEENLQLMRRLDEQFLETPYYGSRQMVYHLKRQGYQVGRKRVRRLMAKMGLTVIYPKPRTSQPHPENRVYPYLLRDLAVSRPDQVWCADVTYIPMRRGFLYLVAIMDWYSRRVLSWRLSNALEPFSCCEALEERSTGTITRRSSIRTRGVSSPARSSRDYSRRPGCVSRWTAGAAGWTTSSSSVCGVHSNTNASI